MPKHSALPLASPDDISCDDRHTRRWVAHCLLYSLLWSLALGTATVAAQPLWQEKNPPEAPISALQQLNEALISLTDALLPGVVSLKVYTTTESAEALPSNHPPVPDQEPGFVTGSGFIIRADGLALTNNHVIEDHTRIEVLLYDGTLTSAIVLGNDPVGDMALLKIATAHPLPVLPLGHAAALRVGEFVVAVGSPFGFEHTVTFGIVSAKKRNFLRSGVVGGYIQTDAPITRGNSGGPLVNMRGEVVGINTATIGRGELGFAIPIDAVKAMLPQLHGVGHVTRGWLGVRIRPLDQDKVQNLGLTSAHGVYVHDVLHAQPAYQAGIVVGDVIVQFDGHQVETPFDLQSAVASTPVGKKVRIELLRKRARQTVEVLLGSMPEQ